MKKTLYILTHLFVLNLFVSTSFSQDKAPVTVAFYGDTLEILPTQFAFTGFAEPLSGHSIRQFYEQISLTNYQPLIKQLLDYKEKYRLDDWLYYQLIRKTAQQISPKLENYHRYTLYKWFLLSKSGYDATLSINSNQLLFYVQSDEDIFNIPYHIRNGKQYVCLNYHDYGGNIDFEKNKFTPVSITVPGAKQAFSYKVTSLPEFKKDDYSEKDLQFSYYQNEYQFKIKLNPEIKAIFANYPVVDYESYFNIPMSRGTYESLIPLLKENLKGMKQKAGIDYLMRFTRYAFLYEKDSEVFGAEKRLSPEQTLLFEYSDCEDRAALFFYLVKEIYNLPMIVLAYPKHVTIAVKFDKPLGKPIVYNGEQYTVCEPTPQQYDLKLGKTLKKLKNETFEIVYAYHPVKK